MQPANSHRPLQKYLFADRGSASVGPETNGEAQGLKGFNLGAGIGRIPMLLPLFAVVCIIFHLPPVFGEHGAGARKTLTPAKTARIV